ncbi:MAG: hypothetical protein ICV69_05670 [Thermoleophilaceae bacterium]|nr:hypothetical protein [Thermoleophilaceae bacterium]
MGSCRGRPALGWRGFHLPWTLFHWQMVENAVRETAHMWVLVQRRWRWGDLAGARVRRPNGLVPRARRETAGV